MLACVSMPTLRLGTAELCNQDDTGFTKVTGTVSALKVDYTHLQMDWLKMASACNSRKKKPNDVEFIVKSLSDNECTAGV